VAKPLPTSPAARHSHSALARPGRRHRLLPGICRSRPSTRRRHRPASCNKVQTPSARSAAWTTSHRANDRTSLRRIGPLRLAAIVANLGAECGVRRTDASRGAMTEGVRARLRSGHLSNEQDIWRGSVLPPRSAQPSGNARRADICGRRGALPRRLVRRRPDCRRPASASPRASSAPRHAGSR
jgi:hypothetical protein